jgi:hypothetical protein
VTIHLPDVSEFQPNVDWAKVNKSNGGAAIIRAAYGTSHLDHAWYGGARRKDFWSHGGKVLGIYQYLVADQDPVAQARALRKIVGKLQPGEFLVCDLEEGGGDQAHRFHAWADELSDLVYPGYQGHWLYSSSYFFQAHGLMPIAHSKTHTWVAAYGSIEPSVPHSLWQYTSTGVVPGTPGQGARVTTRIIESLQHHVGATVDGAWGKNNCALQGARCESQTTRRLQAFLNHHGAKPKAPNTGTLGGPTIKALQRFLNQKVGLYT